MESWIRDVRYILMPAKHPVTGYEKEYQEAYQCWRTAWEKFRKEINVTDHLYSEPFLASDEIGVLYYQGKCVGLSCYTFGSLENNSPTKDLAWFRGWDDLSLQKLKNMSNNIVISSQFSVSPEFTGKNQVVRWKNILFFYILRRFECSEADVMAGHINLTRKVDDSCGEVAGATILNAYQPFDYYGVELGSQLSAYLRHNIEAMKVKRDLVQQFEDLWAQTTSVSPHSITNYNKTKKIA